jgi:hypothetical protein
LSKLLGKYDGLQMIEYRNSEPIQNDQLRLEYFKCVLNDEGNIDVWCNYQYKTNGITIQHESYYAFDKMDMIKEYIEKKEIVEKQGIYYLGTDHSSDEWTDRTTTSIPHSNCKKALGKSCELAKKFLEEMH